MSELAPTLHRGAPETESEQRAREVAEQNARLQWFRERRERQKAEERKQIEMKCAKLRSDVNFMEKIKKRQLKRLKNVRVEDTHQKKVEAVMVMQRIFRNYMPLRAARKARQIEMENKQLREELRQRAKQALNWD